MLVFSQHGPSLFVERLTGGFFIGDFLSSTYNRPHLSVADQLALVKQRGLSVSDDATALSYLRRLGYYRLSAYWFPLRAKTLTTVGGKLVRQVSNNFVPGATFQSAVDLYVFDKALRMLVVDALERIEVAIRVDVAHYLGQVDTFAQVKPNLLHGHFSRKVQARSGMTKHAEWLVKLDLLTEKSKEDFVSHYKNSYGLPLPIWVSIEVWDFGLLSNFFAGMLETDKRALAQRFGVPDPAVMESWLRTLNYVRNLAAHHSRLWNRNMIDQPKMPSAGDIPMFDPVLATINVARPYASLCIISYLMKQICPNSSWQARMVNLFSRFPEVPAPPTDISATGCQPGWEREGFWQ